MRMRPAVAYLQVVVRSHAGCDSRAAILRSTPLDIWPRRRTVEAPPYPRRGGAILRQVLQRGSATLSSAATLAGHCSSGPKGALLARVRGGRDILARVTTHLREAPD